MEARKIKGWEGIAKAWGVQLIKIDIGKSIDKSKAIDNP